MPSLFVHLTPGTGLSALLKHLGQDRDSSRKVNTLFIVPSATKVKQVFFGNNSARLPDMELSFIFPGDLYLTTAMFDELCSKDARAWHELGVNEGEKGSLADPFGSTQDSEIYADVMGANAVIKDMKATQKASKGAAGGAAFAPASSQSVALGAVAILGPSAFKNLKQMCVEGVPRAEGGKHDQLGLTQTVTECKNDNHQCLYESMYGYVISLNEGLTILEVQKMVNHIIGTNKSYEKKHDKDSLHKLSLPELYSGYWEPLRASIASGTLPDIYRKYSQVYQDAVEALDKARSITLPIAPIISGNNMGDELETKCELEQTGNNTAIGNEDQDVREKENVKRLLESAEKAQAAKKARVTAKGRAAKQARSKN